jgi:hypothetical protein
MMTGKKMTGQKSTSPEFASIKMATWQRSVPPDGGQVHRW